MANIVTNIIYSNNMDKVREMLYNDKQDVDFGKLIPRPTEFDLTIHDWDETREVESLIKPICEEMYSKANDYREYMELLTNFSIAEENKEVMNKIVHSIEENFYTQMEHLFNPRTPVLPLQVFKEVALSYWNSHKYGCTTSVRWGRENWGVKGNAYKDYTVDNGNSIEFGTAWNCPTPVLKELAKHVDFTCLYADEDNGSNLGAVVAKNGEVEMIEFDGTVENLNSRVAMSWTIRGYDAVDEAEDWNEYYDGEDMITLEEIKEGIDILNEVIKEYDKFTVREV